ncbi:MAG TPA: DNA alkylation repair protein [Candidatus Limnocylindrales bacterium]|jgi:3-methyladenine DNA glycosylase AlkD
MPAHPTDPTAAAFIARLEGEASEAERLKYRRYFPERHHEFIGVRMGAVFAAARDFASLDLDQIERLLEHDAHEVRAGAVRILAEQAKARATTADRLQALAALYLRRHDRIDDWDLVDLGAWEVLGRSLVDRPRDVLDDLAESDDPWRRRSAITATFAFIRREELDDTYRIAGRLLDDEHELVRKAVGWALRHAGDHDAERLDAFLETHAATMPRSTLRNAIEKLPPEERQRLLALGRRG